ncbi:MAG: flagellar basal-body MS-ring/collar protein FliF [Polymorphobacter sp.]
MSELVPQGALQMPAALAGARLWGSSVLAQPAVRKSLPLIIAGLVVLVGVVGWMMLRTPDYRPLFPSLAEADRAAVIAALEAGNFHARINAENGAVEIVGAEAAAARIMLAGQGLPKAVPTGYDLLGAMPLGTSRAVEAARLRQSQESELAASVAAIDGVSHASVHLAAGEASVFIRDRAAPSASVFVTLAPGRALGEAQVRAIVYMVATSIAGLAPDRISVVDQSGALLSGDPGAGLAGESQKQLAYQARVEAMYRQRIVTLLTPILGQGNFSTEVSADVDFTQTEATRENFDRDGSVLRSEQGSNSSEVAPSPAKGIPGALSNSVPGTAPASATPPAADVGVGGTPTGPKSETYARNFEIGRAVSVTRAPGAQVRRLSVAVVVRDSSLGAAKGQAAQVNTLTGLVRSAIGFDARRGDVVTVAGRAFAATDEKVGSWYEKPVVQDSGILIAVVAGLALVVLGVVRPLLQRRTALAQLQIAAAAQGQIISPDGLVLPFGGIDYAAKLAQTRTLVAEDVGRASAVVRQMIRTDAA